VYIFRIRFFVFWHGRNKKLCGTLVYGYSILVYNETIKHCAADSMFALLNVTQKVIVFQNFY